MTPIAILRMNHAASSGDPHFANVVFLSGFEGGSVIDESPLAQTVTLVGTIAASAAQAKFGTKSLLRDGSGGLTTDVAKVPDNAAFFTGTAHFTVECWIYQKTLPSNSSMRSIVAQYNGTSGVGWHLSVNNTTLEFDYESGVDGNSIDVAWAPSANTWYHLAVDFDGTKYRLYVNGSMIGSSTYIVALDDISVPLAIGNRTTSTGTGLNSDLDAHLDEVRVTAGFARYASDGGFTAPTAAFPRS